MYTFCTMVYVHFFWTVHSTLTLGFLTEREVLSYTAYMYAVKCLVSRGLLRGEFEGCKQPQRSLQLTRWCCCCSRTAVSFAGSAWKTESGFFIEGRRVFFFLARSPPLFSTFVRDSLRDVLTEEKSRLKPQRTFSYFGNSVIHDRISKEAFKCTIWIFVRAVCARNWDFNAHAHFW